MRPLCPGPLGPTIGLLLTALLLPLSGCNGNGRAGAPAPPHTAGAMPPATMPASGAVAPTAVYNPNFYLASTYLGGSGERERLEKLVDQGVLLDGKRVKLEAFPRNYGQSFPIATK